jgi:hypothetical protein
VHRRARQAMETGGKYRELVHAFDLATAPSRAASPDAATPTSPSRHHTGSPTRAPRALDRRNTPPSNPR